MKSGFTPGMLSRLLLLLIALLGGLGNHAVLAQPVPPQQILVLYAYGYGGRGVELFSDGFFDALTEAGFPVSNVHAEYLDLQRNMNVPGYRKELLNVLQQKYAAQRIDLIVTVQQPALEFLLTEGTNIAAQAPVITLQAGPLPNAETTGHHIVVESNKFDIKGTLERALELFPQTGHVVFASGSSAADTALAEEATRIAEPWRTRLEVETTAGKSLAEILQRVASLPPHSIIIFTQYNVDTKGRVALAYEVEKMIVGEANAPVFGLYDYNLKNGGIGGSVIAVEESGARAARLAVGVLNGDSTVAHSTLRQNENIPMFDWQQIRRWGGDASRLPENTVFINRPPPLWQEHPYLIAGTVTFILAQSGMIALLLASYRRRKRAEGLLRESEEYLHAIFDSALDGIVLVNLQTRRFVRGNAAICRMLGYSPEEFIRLGIADIHLQQDLPHVMETVEQQLRGDIQLAIGIRVKRKDDSVFYADINATTAIVNGRRYLLGIFRDISERRQAEETLRESEQRFHDIVSASADWIWEVDADARYTYASENVIDLLGYTPQEIIGKAPFDLMPPEEAARVRVIFAGIATKGLPFRNLDNINLHKDGSRRHVLSNGMPIKDEQGRVTGYRGLDMDVTEKTQAEIELRERTREVHRRNEELERFNRVSVGRELEMIALKQQVNELSRQLGQDRPYPLSFLDVPDKSDPDAPAS